jgi:hypothetical protein
VAEHPPDRGVVEPRAVVIELEEDLVAVVRGEREREVRLLVQRERAALPFPAAGPEDGVQLVVLDHEQRFEERRPARHLAPALDRRERRVLDRAERDVRGAQRLEPGEQGRVRFDPHAHRQRVDEQADDLVRPRHGGVPAGAGGAEDDIVLAAVAPQQQRPGTLQERVQGQAVRGGERAQGGGRRGGERRGLRAVLRSRIRRGRREPVHDQRRRRGEALEHLAPEGLGPRRLLRPSQSMKAR